MFPKLKIAENLCYNMAMFNAMQNNYSAQAHIGGLMEGDYIWFYIFDAKCAVVFRKTIDTIDDMWEALSEMRKLNAMSCESGEEVHSA